MLFEVAALIGAGGVLIELSESVLILFDPFVGPLRVEFVSIHSNLLVGLLPQIRELLHLMINIFQPLLKV